MNHTSCMLLRTCWKVFVIFLPNQNRSHPDLLLKSHRQFIFLADCFEQLFIYFAHLSSNIKGLKATNERQDNGAGMLHKVAQLTKYIYIYIYIQGAHAPLCLRKTQTDKVVAAKQVCLYIPLNPPPLAQRGSWNVWVVKNYQRWACPWMYETLSTTPQCLHVPRMWLANCWHSGTQLLLGQHRQLV